MPSQWHEALILLFRNRPELARDVLLTDVQPPEYRADLVVLLLRREVWLLVVTPDEVVARWASTPISLGGGNAFTPLVLGPAEVHR